MKNITVNRKKRVIDLEREIELNNGALVILKNDTGINNVYMVVSFRDNKNRYEGDCTTKYCTLLKLDSGAFAFEERCSRKTTVRRVLNHILRLGCADYSYNASIPIERYGNLDIEVCKLGNYSIDLSI